MSAAAPVRQTAGEHRARPDTRSAVRDLLLERGPSTAAEIATALGLTPAAVRRHLDQLLATTEVEPISRPASGARGRPARAFRLTATGRGGAGHQYDELARDAIAELRRLAGPAAVTALARRRVREVLGHVRPAEGPGDVERAARDVAEALSEAGYAASVEGAGGGVQICQHHCPVWNVASGFPELCSAEQEVVSEIVGSHVQRLATIAGGDCACTTNIPAPAVTADALLATIPTPTAHPDPHGVDASSDPDERTKR